MKVLHVDPAPTWRGGERQVHFLVRGLMARGVDCVVIASPGSPLSERLAADGVRVIGIPMRGDLDLVGILRTHRAIRNEHPDVLHLHTSRAHGVGGLAGRWAGVRPIVVTRRLELPPRGPAAGWKYGRLADHYVSISKAVHDSLEAGGVPADRITCIPSGVEIPEASAAPPAHEPFTVGTLAAFTAQKDPDAWVDTVLRVARIRPEIRFVWAGEGELRPRVAGAIREAGIQERVQILDFLTDPEAVWRRLSAFFLPSAFEALGTVFLDAMARAIPIVATRVGGIPEIVRHEQEGLLVDPGDPQGLANAIVRLHDDAALRERLGAAGRERSTEFEIGRIVERVHGLYESLRREFAA